MNYIPRHGSYEVRVHTAFRDRQKAINDAWKAYHDAVHEYGMESGEAMAAEMNLREVRRSMRRSMNYWRDHG